jgi:hypothetical protein
LVEASVERNIAATDDFNRLFANTMVVSLSNMLGEAVAKSAARALRLEPSSSPEAVLLNLRKVFGNGSNVVEKIALKELLGRMDIPWEEQSSLDSSALIEVARRKFESGRGGAG